MAKGALDHKRAEFIALAQTAFDRMFGDDGRPGVRQPHWSDTKVGCFQTYTSIICRKDPQPDPPAIFLDAPRVVRLCQEMEQIRGNPATRPTAAEVASGLV